MDEIPAIQTFCTWLSETRAAVAIRESEYLFPWIESIHVLALTLVVGSISVVDLRLLGLASRNRPVTSLMRDVLPVTWIAFAVAAATGFGLFASNAPEYVRNVPFQMKLLLLSLAGLNMAFFHKVTCRTVRQWDAADRTPAAARLAGALSLTFWVGIVAFGRWIGFTIGI